MAQLTTLLANVNRPRDRQAFKIDDFIWRDPQEAKEKETWRVLATMQAMAKRAK